MTREDALDILSLISFLYRQVDKTHFVSQKWIIEERAIVTPTISQ
jgi:uncharacterized membrane protein YsdA (DUF1294 family)